LNRSTLIMVGFWQDSDDPESPFPHPRDLISPNWMGSERPRILQYLAEGRVFARYMGFAAPRFPGLSERELGATSLNDGVWVWPEGLRVYVDRFDVRLPDEFIDHMRRNDYAVPELDGDALSDAGVEEDVDFWLSWARANLK
jgi:hypothetical protein